jgi:hypothetical protein
MSENPNTPLPVDEETLLRVLTWLHAAGVGFVLDRMPYDDFSLDPSEVMEYLADSEAFLAEAMGVLMEDYRDWQAVRRAIQCHAKTKSGRRCRNMIAEANDYLTPRAWVALQAQQPTCRMHGGRVATAMERRETED